MASNCIPSSSESLFLTAIRQSIDEWPALRLSVDHGMGGGEATLKIHWLAQVMEQFFKENGNLYEDEVSDFVSQILNNEFDTIIEDGSVEIFSKLICNYHGLISSGKDDQVKHLLEERKKMDLVKKCVEAVGRVSKMPDEEMKGLSIGDEVPVQDNNNQGNGIESEPMNEDTDNQSAQEENNGWTLVQRKHKR